MLCISDSPKACKLARDVQGSPKTTGLQGPAWYPKKQPQEGQVRVKRNWRRFHISRSTNAVSGTDLSLLSLPSITPWCFLLTALHLSTEVPAGISSGSGYPQGRSRGTAQSSRPLSEAVFYILMFPLSMPGNVHIQFHNETVAQELNLRRLGAPPPWRVFRGKSPSLTAQASFSSAVAAARALPGLCHI